MERPSASKKRKITHAGAAHDDEEELEDDEQKIEKFFALIKNLREARDRLMINGGSNAFNGTDQKRQQTHAVWKPSFQREDFMEEAAPPLKNPPVTAALVDSSDDQSQRGGANYKENENITEGLDLRLSL